jgi:hypothetical protein
VCFRFATRTIVAAALLGVMLGGCSENYLDRRDTISLVSGEAMAANRVTQMIDPWPAASGNRTIAYNGQVAASASERYRTGKVTKPVSATTSSASYSQSQSPSPSSGDSQSSPGGGNAGGSANK